MMQVGLWIEELWTIVENPRLQKRGFNYITLYFSVKNAWRVALSDTL